MAEQTPKGAPKKPVPYPANWSKMSGQERRAWEQKNKGHAPRPIAPPKQAAPPEPKPEPKPPVEEYPPTETTEGSEGTEDQGEYTPGAELVKLTVQVGDGEPHEATPESFLPTLLRALADHYSGACDSAES